MPIDVGVGRRIRPLGPLTITVGAPREVVFDVISQPYLGRGTRAMKGKVRVLHAGSEHGARRPPHPAEQPAGRDHRGDRPLHPAGRVEFRLVRGPVPYVVEEFVLPERDRGTELTYRGELATDFGPDERRGIAGQHGLGAAGTGEVMMCAPNGRGS